MTTALDDNQEDRMAAEAIAPAPPGPAGTRDRALATALALFGRDGYDAVSMRAIAEELGVTKAALYHHFTSKEEIARELVGSYFAAVDDMVAWARTTEPELDELLDRWADLVRAQGLAVSKFLHTNQRLIRELGLHGPDGPRRAIDQIADTVADVDSPAELRMQVRTALIVLHTAAIAGEGLPIDSDEVFRIAKGVAADIVRNAAR